MSGHSTPRGTAECPTWCINRAAVPHSHHTADVAEYETPTFAVEVTLSRNDGAGPAVVRLFTHTHDNTTVADLDPGVASVLADTIGALAGDSLRGSEFAAALGAAAAVLLGDDAPTVGGGV